jgi:hypothetical protein
VRSPLATVNLPLLGSAATELHRRRSPWRAPRMGACQRRRPRRSCATSELTRLLAPFGAAFPTTDGLGRRLGADPRHETSVADDSGHRGLLCLIQLQMEIARRYFEAGGRGQKLKRVYCPRRASASNLDTKFSNLALVQNSALFFVHGIEATIDKARTNL